jgi:glycerol-3-phosphate dehydrogenase (NAD(P)+)
MAEQQINVAVLGGGSFGTALASIAADNGAQVVNGCETKRWLRR